MKISKFIRTRSAITGAFALAWLAPVAYPLLALTAADASAEEVTVMRHTTRPLPGYGTLTLEIWNDGTKVQVVGLDTQGRIVLAREGTMNTEPTLEGTGAIEGILPAEELTATAEARIVRNRCTTPSCARRWQRRACAAPSSRQAPVTPST